MGLPVLYRMSLRLFPRVSCGLPVYSSFPRREAPVLTDEDHEAIQWQTTHMRVISDWPEVGTTAVAVYLFTMPWRRTRFLSIVCVAGLLLSIALVCLNSTQTNVSTIGGISNAVIFLTLLIGFIGDSVLRQQTVVWLLNQQTRTATLYVHPLLLPFMVKANIQTLGRKRFSQAFSTPDDTIHLSSVGAATFSTDGRWWSVTVPSCLDDDARYVDLLRTPFGSTLGYQSHKFKCAIDAENLCNLWNGMANGHPSAKPVDELASSDRYVAVELEKSPEAPKQPSADDEVLARLDRLERLLFYNPLVPSAPLPPPSYE